MRSILIIVLHFSMSHSSQVLSHFVFLESIGLTSSHSGMIGTTFCSTVAVKVRLYRIVKVKFDFRIVNERNCGYTLFENGKMWWVVRVFTSIVVVSIIVFVFGYRKLFTRLFTWHHLSQLPDGVSSFLVTSCPNV